MGIITILIAVLLVIEVFSWWWIMLFLISFPGTVQAANRLYKKDYK